MQQTTTDRNAGTREKLVATARMLLAERGIERVSMREISREAGQGNVSALQYHFGDREQLIAAVLASENLEVETRRAALLDDIDARSVGDARSFASALVRPAASMLATEAGREHLRIVAQIVNRSDIGARFEAMLEQSPSMARWRTMSASCMPDEGARLHRRFTAYQLCSVELGRRAELGARREQQLFVSHLIDLCAAILTAPISDETKELLSETKKRRSGKE